MDLTICIGYDSREPLTLDVLAHSIVRRASRPVTILPIALNHLKGIYTRTDPAGTTEFSLTRFLTPYLCDYRGFGLFMDSDMVCLTDIYRVFEGVLPLRGKAVYCCQHDYVPKADTLKATGIQTSYPRKNWSSLMLFDNTACLSLSPAYINAASPSDLHRLVWARESIWDNDRGCYADEERESVGSLPLEWNWLVGEYDDNPNAKVLHYTLGSPCFPGYEDGPMAEVWWEEYRSMMAPMKTYQCGTSEAYAKAVGARR
jgi:hypothetical protein